MRIRVPSVAIAVSLAVVVLGDRSSLAETTNRPAATSAEARPSQWATKLDKPGLPNLHQVTTNLFRGAQPTEQGMAELKAMEIKTVINLRAFHSDKDELAGTDLKAERLYVKTWHPKDEDVVRFLKIVTDTNSQPTFVHCQHGADRTGVMCAMYRIAVCGWTKQEAIAEMTKGGFGFHPVWKNLIRYVERANVEKLKKQAGLATK
jgi:protein tyrosine/serine phosphatase